MFLSLLSWGTDLPAPLHALLNLLFRPFAGTLLQAVGDLSQIPDKGKDQVSSSKQALSILLYENKKIGTGAQKL